MKAARSSGPEIRRYDGPREDLRALFELAEDSPSRLESYWKRGEVIVAQADGRVVGYIQTVPTARPGELEVKSMAVEERQHGRGIGRSLVEAAVAGARAESHDCLLVATAAADTGNLRFYQRLGFRMLRVERDAFTAADGYPPDLKVDGIPLRDRVWLSRSLRCRAPR